MTASLEALARSLHPIVSRLRLDVTAVRNAKGQVYRSDEPLTQERLHRHLNGGSSRGLYIIKEGKSTVECAVMDLDDHSGKLGWSKMVDIAEALVEACSERGLKAIPFRSSGGSGIHLWFLWEKPQDAYSVRVAMREALATINFTDGTAGVSNNQIEVYPRQNEVKEGRYGNQVWLPLARNSVPLDTSGMFAGLLQPMPRSATLSLKWHTSAPVKRREPPKIKVGQASNENTDMQRYRSMLSFIGFDTGDDYSYDVWMEVGFGLHHASGASDEGFYIWNEWSAKGASYIGEEECRYKWDTMHEDNIGDDMVTGRTVEWRARKWGWQDDLSGDFEDLTGQAAGDQKSVAQQTMREARRKEPDALRDGASNVLIFTDKTDWFDICEKIRRRLFIVEGLPTALFSQGAWYLYEDGFWRFAERIEIEKQVREILNTAWVIDSGDGMRKKPFKPAKRHVSEVLNGLECDCLVRDLVSPMWLDNNDTDAREWLCLEDGILNVSSQTLLDHSPAYFTLNKLPFSWNAEDTGIDLWTRFLHQVWPDDKESIECLQEWFGYLLTADTSLQKMLLMYGPRRTGKGTIGRILTRLLGDNNVASTSIAALSSQFGLQTLLDKLVALLPDTRNISSRASNVQVAVERMLSISGEDKINVERKFEGAWNGRLPARFVLMANELPSPGDSSEAFTGRFIILKTAVSFFGREDTRLEGKLSAELPGILHWAIAGRQRLQARGFFVQPSSGTADVENMLDANNPVRGFVRYFIQSYKEEQKQLLLGGLDVASVETDPDRASEGGGTDEWDLSAVPFDLLYSKYGRWCGREGFHHPERKSIFEKSLASAFDGRVDVQYRRIGGGGGKRTRFVVGMSSIDI